MSFRFFLYYVHVTNTVYYYIFKVYKQLIFTFFELIYTTKKNIYKNRTKETLATKCERVCSRMTCWTKLSFRGELLCCQKLFNLPSNHYKRGYQRQILSWPRFLRQTIGKIAKWTHFSDYVRLQELDSHYSYSTYYSRDKKNLISTKILSKRIYIEVAVGLGCNRIYDEDLLGISSLEEGI